MSTLMLHSSADVARYALIAAGAGILPTDDNENDVWPIYEATEPNKPDNCITVYDTTGVDDGRVMNDGELQTHDGIQVRVRSSDQKVGAAKANAIRQIMAESTALYYKTVSVDTSSYLFRNFANIGNVLSLGTERLPSKRRLWTINATCSVDLLR